MAWAEDGLEERFYKMNFSCEAMKLLVKLLGGNAFLATQLVNVLRPCAFEAHGETPAAYVDIHQNREIACRDKVGWAIAVWRGKPVENNRLTGRWIDDIVIATRDLKKIVGSMTGTYLMPVLGNPEHIYCRHLEPMRIFQSPLQWISGAGDGVVLFGREREQVAWLRDCEAGIVTDSVAHGERIQKMIRREIVGPKILVAEA